MEASQSYFAGMNQDTALNKRSPDSYYYMKNLRVVTEEGLSTGSLENEKGHLLGFIVPNIGEVTYGDTVIPAQTNLKIIGWTTLREYIIVFTTSETSDSPTNSVGQIWKIEFNEATNTIIGASSGVLNSTIHLIYNNYVNFSTSYRIKAIGRYENENTQGVYWTDYYNAVRSINTADPNSLLLDPATLDLTPSVYFTQAEVLDIGNGSLPTGVEIQLGYQLLNAGGAETLYSPLSPLIPLTFQGFDITNFNDFEGTGNPTLLQRSITYQITGIDTTYEIIRHIAVVYTEPGVYTVYRFQEDLINSTGETTVTLTSLTDAIQIPLVEFNILSSGFDVAKDIESKSNRLIAANTKTKSFDLDYDARTYRFDVARDALIKDSSLGNITIDGTAPDYDINIEHNAINDYNDESIVNWAVNSQYKFQADGTTLGGSGPNISYEFVTQELASNFNLGNTSAPPHIAVNTWTAIDGPSTLDVLNKDGSNKLINRVGQFKNFASQWAHSNFVGYSRGETYRFAIVFYNKKGSVSFAKWIGDIRFPDVEDGFPLQNTISGIPYLYSLGIRFTVDTTSILDQISGFAIVRVERNEEDKTKLGSGILMNFDIQDPDDENSIIQRWQTTGPEGGTFPAVDNDVDIVGSVESGNLHLMDRPGFGAIAAANPGVRRFCTMLSPLGQFYAPDFKTGDYIRTRAFYSSRAYKYGGDTSGSPSDSDYGFSYKLAAYVPNDNYELFEIRKLRVLRGGEFIFGSDSYMSDEAPGNNLMNASYSREGGGANEEVPLGVGPQKMSFILHSTPTIPNNSGDPAFEASWIGEWNAESSIDFAGTDITSTVFNFKEIVYARYLTSQYGGNTYVNRSTNQYISTNHYQVTEDTTNPIYTFSVFGGDTYVNYYDDEQIEQYRTPDTVINAPYKGPGDNKLSVAICFPVESPYNTNYRPRRHWATDRNGSDMGSYSGYIFPYNKVWLQENSTEEKYFAKDFLFRFTEEHPHQLWASEEKIDGELIDSWRIFKIANATEVEGIYGPINRIINFKDNLYFYQDAAFGVASIDERSLITDESGQQLTLGTGGVFPNYSYISRNTGSIHQFGVVASENALYHYDARLKKIYQFSGQLGSLSDLKGMSSMFDNDINGNILKKDKTLQRTNEGPIGIHSEVDFRYNRILFTFLNRETVLGIEDYSPTASIYVFSVNDIVYQNGIIYKVLTNSTIESDDLILADYPLVFTSIKRSANADLTISYNEMIQAFESFYDYTPGLYLQTGRRLLSASPFQLNRAFIHNVGNYCKYYDQTESDSIIHTILGIGGNSMKIFNNIQFLNEVYNSTNGDIYNETYSMLRFYNEYQDTGNINLLPDVNIKRRMRTWRTIIPRDMTDGKSRMRNAWLHCVMTFNNNNNKRNVLHELTYSFTPSQF